MFKEKPAVCKEHFTRIQDFRDASVIGTEVRVISKQMITGRDLETLKSVGWVFHMEIKGHFYWI